MIKKRFLYSKRDLNPHSRNGQGILSPSCLPIPPFERSDCAKVIIFLHSGKTMAPKYNIRANCKKYVPANFPERRNAEHYVRQISKYV